MHQIPIACGITSCVLLCASYSQRALWFVPGDGLRSAFVPHSLVDELFHWHRYWSRASDRLETWSHVFILIGHGTMIGAWWPWRARGYQGVATALSLGQM